MKVERVDGLVYMIVNANGVANTIEQQARLPFVLGARRVATGFM